MTKTAVVILAEGFEEIEAVTPVDVLRRAGVEITLLSCNDDETSLSVKGAHGVSYLCEAKLSAYNDTPDAVILPGGMPGSANLGACPAVQALVEKVAQQGGICAAICAAPALTFAKYGLLAGKTATCYPSFEKEFAADTTHSAESVVVDGNIVTSRGPGTALAFSLQLAKMLVGEDTVQELRAGMLVDEK